MKNEQEDSVGIDQVVEVLQFEIFGYLLYKIYEDSNEKKQKKNNNYEEFFTNLLQLYRYFKYNKVYKIQNYDLPSNMAKIESLKDILG